MWTSRLGAIATAIMLLAFSTEGEGAPESQDRAREEVKVLETVVAARQAALAVEKKAFEVVTRRFERMEKARRTPLVCGNDDDYFDLILSEQVARARVDCREAELRESNLRLAQAKRHLAALHPPVVSPAAKPSADTGERQQARDEVELLEAGLGAKQASVTVEKKTLDKARRRVARMDAARKAAAGSVPESDYRAAVLEVETATAQVAVREAELKEHEVRLARAKRRLAALDPPAPRMEKAK